MSVPRQALDSLFKIILTNEQTDDLIAKENIWMGGSLDAFISSGIPSSG